MGISRRRLRDSTLQNRAQNQGLNTAIIAAMITATAGVLVAFIPALFGFPPFIEIFQKAPTPTIVLTATDTLIPATATDLVQLIATESSTLTPTIAETSSPAPTQTPIPTATATATDTAMPTSTAGLPVGMDVQLITDTTSGRHPLTVNFDARGSFFRDAKGDLYPCGVCNYTWYVYQNSNLINSPERSRNGIFSYRFGKDGDYRVVVRVCRGQGDSDCAFDAEDITVR